MRKPLKLINLTVLCLSLSSVTANAQFFDKLKDKASAALKKAQEVEEVTNDAKAASAGAPSLGDGPDDSLIAFTKCAGINIENVMIGSLGDYEFQQGFSKEKRGGMINRQPASVQKECILPSIMSRQVIYMEVDSEQYSGMGSANDWEMQCVKSADPGAVAVGNDEPKSEYPYKVDFLAPKDYLLHCGHNVEHAGQCAEGSNSTRSGEWDKNLKARGKTMLSVHGNTSTLAPANGENLYCQYYNKSTRSSLFAFEYLRTRN